MRAAHVVGAKEGEAGLVEVIDERRFVVDDVAIEQGAAPERIGRDRVDRFVVRPERPEERG